MILSKFSFRSQYVANGTARQSTANVGRFLFDFPAIPSTYQLLKILTLEVNFNWFECI